MTRKQKERAIKKHVADMLKQSHKAMVSNIDNAIKSGAIDIEAWDPDNAPMILPKCIVTAILIRESQQYEGKGTSYAKQIKKEVDNLLYFI